MPFPIIPGSLDAALLYHPGSSDCSSPIMPGSMSAALLHHPRERRLCPSPSYWELGCYPSSLSQGTLMLPLVGREPGGEYISRVHAADCGPGSYFLPTHHPGNSFMNSETRFALGGSSAKPCSGGPSNEAFPSPPTFPQLRSQNLNFQLPDMGLLSWTALIFFSLSPEMVTLSCGAPITGPSLLEGSAGSWAELSSCCTPVPLAVPLPTRQHSSTPPVTCL